LAGSIEKCLERPTADRLPKFADRPELDLADAFPGELEFATKSFEREDVSVLKSVTELDDLFLAECQGLEHSL
jgi:hypothetical protein